MKEKKGFILYNDYRESFELLNDKEAKELILAIFDYHKNGTINTLHNIPKMAFQFIKNDLDRQLDKYHNICKRNQQNGLRGGRPPGIPKNPVGLSKTQTIPNNPSEPKKPDTDKDTDKDTDIDKDTNKIDIKEIYKEKFEQFWKLYPKRSGKKLGKSKTRELFLNLNENILDEVIEGTKRYSYQNDNAKDPERFIKHEIWKDCNKYHGEIMEQAKSIYLEYPKKLGGILAINSICEAFKKIEYQKLLVLTKRFAQKQKEIGTEEKFIKSAANWFDSESWIDIEAEEAKKKEEF